MLVACTAPEPAAEVPAWLRDDGERAPADLPEKPGDPRWRVLTSIPECDAHLAADPAKLGRTLEWRPCATGKPGCRELVPPYINSAFGQIDISLLAATTARGVQVLLFEPNGGPERQRISVGPLDGPPFIVFDLKSHGGKCSFVNALFAADSAAVALIREANIDHNETIWFAGPLRADPAWHEPAARILTPQTAVRTGETSLSGRSLVHAHEEGVRRSDPASASFLPVQAAPGMHHGFAVGASYVYATGDRIVVAAAPGAPIPLYASPEGAVIGPAYLEGERFFWAQGYGKDQVGRFDRIELWTALATDDPGISPRAGSPTRRCTSFATSTASRQGTACWPIGSSTSRPRSCGRSSSMSRAVSVASGDPAPMRRPTRCCSSTARSSACTSWTTAAAAIAGSVSTCSTRCEPRAATDTLRSCRSRRSSPPPTPPLRSGGC